MFDVNHNTTNNAYYYVSVRRSRRQAKSPLLYSYCFSSTTYSKHILILIASHLFACHYGSVGWRTKGQTKSPLLVVSVIYTRTRFFEEQ